MGASDAVDGGAAGGGGGGDSGHSGSLYRRALAAGVSEVLVSYESAILRLEQEILRGAGAYTRPLFSST